MMITIISEKNHTSWSLQSNFTLITAHNTIQITISYSDTLQCRHTTAATQLEKVPPKLMKTLALHPRAEKAVRHRQRKDHYRREKTKTKKRKRETKKRKTKKRKTKMKIK